MLTTHRSIGTIGYMGGIMAVPEEFCWSWGNLLLFAEEALCSNPGEHIHPVRTKFSLHDFARNDLASQMRGDWILMLDCDMAFEPDFVPRLVRLFERNKLDVLVGMYSYKAPPHFPVAYIHNPESDRHEIMARWDGRRDEATGEVSYSGESPELVSVSSAGGGCLLVRRRVFERITAELNENPFDRYPGKGEDHSFFMRLRKLGIPAWIAPSVEADHLEIYGVRTSRDYAPPETVDHEFDRTALQGV